MTLQYDEIGYWSEIKLDIVREYATAYSRILNAQQRPRLTHIYVDAFAGAGKHISKTTKEFVPGSPLNALQVEPPFKEFHFIDIQSTRVEALRELAVERGDVHVHEGDCNQILLDVVYPRAQFKNFRRALCLLDPYGLHLDWKVIETAGNMGSVEIFLNFPMMDMNRNVLWRNPEEVATEQVERMNRFWGDSSWRSAAYTTRNLFELEMKADHANDSVAQAFRQRLRTVAGFGYVPEPMPMRNSQGFVVYYLMFASPNKTGGNIVEDIFKKYRGRNSLMG
ncbi:MAG: three-Cys-motif partner protein TcmP [Dehalococcoidia bacterium]